MSAWWLMTAARLLQVQPRRGEALWRRALEQVGKSPSARQSVKDGKRKREKFSRAQTRFTLSSPRLFQLPGWLFHFIGGRNGARRFLSSVRKSLREACGAKCRSADPHIPSGTIDNNMLRSCHTPCLLPGSPGAAIICCPGCRKCSGARPLC